MRPGKTTGNEVSGPGSRVGCGGTVAFALQVCKHHSFWPDLAEASRSNFSNDSLTASGSRDGSGTHFTEDRSSSGNKMSSGRVDER